MIQSGTDIGRYHILEQLGEGGMAVVYKAYDTVLERNVAIKVLRFNQMSSEVSVKRFQLDAKILTKLDHSSIIKILDFGEFEDIPYLVMEYVSGGTLKQFIGKPIPWQQAVKLLIPIANALGYAHQNEIIHRDVKPSNILLNEKGEPFLTDFGIAKMLETTETLDLTKDGFGIGTPEYMPPEIFDERPLDKRADIYSLGIVLYELVTGRTPFKADTPLAVLKKHTVEPLPHPSMYVPSIPSRVEEILFKALAKKPENRFPSMEEFAGALEDALLNQNIPSHKLPPKPMNPLWVIPIILGVGGLILLLTHFINSNSKDEEITQEIRTTETLEVNTIISLSTQSNSDQTKQTTNAEDPDSGNNFGTGDGVTIELSIGSTFISPVDGMKMVYVPAGEFQMGASEQDTKAYDDEKPQHTVHLDAYWIDQTEVTNGMYELCVGEGVCLEQKKYSHNANTGSYHFNDSSYEDYPAVYVNWEDAKTYCEWAGRRLPTEAEWEKAAKGETTNRYPWGNSEPDTSFANFGGNIGDTVEVGSYPGGASYYSVLDMVGNVYEWVSDWYDENYYSKSELTNPQGPISGDTHVLRGGSFFAEAKYSRITYRESPSSSKTEGYGSGNWGFRCTLDAD